jgi:hypothetical protein
LTKAIEDRKEIKNLLCAKQWGYSEPCLGYMADWIVARPAAYEPEISQYSKENI